MAKHLIYLASGNGARFGSNKLLESFEGKPLYRHGLDVLTEVCRRDPDAVITVVSRYPEIRQTAGMLGLRAVDCPESVLGMSWSIKAGIRGIPTVNPNDFLMFLCADLPYVNPDTVCTLLDMAKPGTETARVCWQDTPGNPVLFSASLIPELMELEGDQGGGVVLRRHACAGVSCKESREILDIDTRADLQTLSF